MPTTHYMQAVLPYIERHLAAELHPEHIAGRHFVSLSRLYRDFYACTGHSIQEYIRKRRISNACEALKCSELPLAIIAGESGYQTQQAFHKQFKSVVGMTPLAYRKNDTYFYFYPFSLHEISLAVRVGAETIPPCAAARFYDACLRGIEDRALAALGDASGRVFGKNGPQSGSRFCYEVMTQRPGEGKTDVYATCVVNYSEPEINDGWNYLYNIWLSASMFEESDGGYFEEYLFQNGRPRKLKLYLPVKKRKTQRHIAIADLPEAVFVVAREKGSCAERRAAEKVVGFLQERHPLLLRNARRFYVCATGDVYAHEGVCTCGLECGGGFRPPQDSGLEVLRVPAGRYAVLPDDRLGDMGVGGEKMAVWLQNNGVAHENEPVFAIYETQNGQYDSENIRMQLFKRLKDDKNG